MSQTLQSVLCITTNKYLVRVLVVLLHARFSVVSPIPFLLAAIFFPGHPYIGSTTVLLDNMLSWKKVSCTFHCLNVQCSKLFSKNDSCRYRDEKRTESRLGKSTSPIPVHVYFQ